MAQGKNGLIGHKLPGTRSIMLSAIGPAYCFGDVGGSPSEQILFGVNDWDISKTGYMASLSLRHVFPNNVGIKATAFYGNYTGSDENSRQSIDYKRHYSFRTDILEFAVHGEYTIFGGPYSRNSSPHTLYVYAGAGIMYGRATLKYNGITIISHPKNRPDDIVKLVNIAPVIPLGLGYQYQFTRTFSLGAEFGWHYIFSDYLDGVHPKFSKNMDALAALSFTFTYKISTTFPSEDKCNCLWP